MNFTVLTITIIAVAVTLALAFNAFVWTKGQKTGKLSPEGLKIEQLAAPLTTIAILFLAFLLVQAYSSWSTAREAEANEATATLLMFREADLLENSRLREVLRQRMVCYATSVIEQDWPAMAEQKSSNVPDYWSNNIRLTAARLVRSGTDKQGAAIISRDSDRETARQQRLALARPSVPTLLYVFMLVAAVVALMIISAVTAKGVSKQLHTVIAILAAVIFTATLLLIRQLDQPYSGVASRQPTRIEAVRRIMEASVSSRLPCNRRGLPIQAPLFHPETSPLH